MKLKEYALWGTKNGNEDIIRVNGKETFKNLSEVKQFKNIIDNRKVFSSTRIQTINMGNFNIKSAFINGIKRHKKK